jgi:hypothetical protein
MTKTIGIIIAVLIAIAVAYPFVQDAYQRHLVRERLISVMTPQERDAFDHWDGDAKSFAESLYKRCELAQGKGAVPCERYRYAYELH